MTKPPRTGNPAKSGKGKPPIPRQQQGNGGITRNAHSNNHAAKQQPSMNIFAWLFSPVQNWSRERKTNREKERAKDPAAHRMANLTTWIMRFTFVATVIAAFQGKALFDSNSDSNAVQRAFVFPESMNQGCTADKCFFTPVWQNYGNTPTQHLVIAGFFQILPSNQDAHKFDFNKSPAGPAVKTLIGPHVHILSGSIIVTKDQVDSVLRGDSKIWAWDRATYRDVFSGSSEHITCVGWEIAPVVYNTLQFEMRMLPLYNCADDDCKGDPCEQGA